MKTIEPSYYTLQAVITNSNHAAQPARLADAAHVFTAAEVAAALGRNRSTVAHALGRVSATGAKIVSGMEARAWKISELLASSLGNAILALTKKLGCADPEAALRQSASPWSPEIPLDECHPDCISQARKLREALRPSLNRQNCAGVSAAELETLGIQDYRQQFGRTITARHWRDLFARTLRRAGSVPDFEKLELYLPERLKRKDAVTDASLRNLGETETRLHDFVCAFADVSNPTPRERESLWTQAMVDVESLTAAGESFNRATRIVRAALRNAAPFLAASPAALQKAFARRLAAWQASGGAARSMADARCNNTGNHDGFELPQADIDALVHYAVWRFHGHIAAAWREAHKVKLLTPQTVQHYPLAQSKSHVPHKVRDAIGAEVEIFMLMKRSKRVADELVPHLTRTFDGLHSCQVYQGDDFTMPVYFYVPDGNGWFSLIRGQVLLFIDFRSSKIVGWSLLPDPQYSSLAIWTQLKRIFKEHGIPELLYFEKGIWQRSTILTGRNIAGQNAAEIVQGLREFGIKFKHAIRPRSKTVERIGGLIQDLMEGEPGYCGRDERHDLPASTKAAMHQVNSRKAHPSALFYSFEQWNDRLGEIIARYNATPQQGIHLAGLSPDQAFDQFMNPDCDRRHSELELNFLLTHKEEREVTTNGITFKVGKNRFRYYGPELATFVRRRVLAAFDPEMPEHLIVTDLNRRNPVLVPLANEVSSMAELTGGEELLAHEISRANGQMAHLRARYNEVKSNLPVRRPVVSSPQGLLTGARVYHLRQKAEAQKKTAVRSSRAASKIGMHIPERARVRETTQADINAVEQFLAMTAEEEKTKS